MNKARLKLTIAMVMTTLAVFLVTFISIYFYQKNYIFDQAIYALEMELEYLDNYDQAPSEILANQARVFNVEVVFPQDGDIYLSPKDKEIIKRYQAQEYVFGEVTSTSNPFGDFYYLVEEVSGDLFRESFDQAGGDETVPIILYVDITSSTNVVKKINYIFFIMLIISVLIEGLVGIYLGSGFEKSQKKLKHFFENASHELKSPLMSIMGYAEGIKRGVITDKTMASDVIIKKSLKMKGLIDEILTISKLDSKEYILRQDRVELEDIVEESIDNFRLVQKERKIELKFEIRSQVRPIIGDGLQIYKAVNTVIDNAFKFAHTTIRIQLYESAKYQYLEIYNDGRPIAKENAKHIFDRFYSQGNFSTGIGLAMAKDILVLGGGDIEFMNQSHGVSFILKFPR